MINKVEEGDSIACKERGCFGVTYLYAINLYHNVNSYDRFHYYHSKILLIEKRYTKPNHPIFAIRADNTNLIIK